MEGLGIFILIISIVIILTLLGIAYFAFWVWMSVDIIRHRWPKRLKWLLINEWIPFGSIFYFFIVKRGEKRKKATDFETLPLISWIVYLCGKFLGFIGLIAGVVSITLASISLKKAKKDKELAKAAIISSIIYLVFISFILVAYFALFAFLIVFAEGIENQEPFPFMEPSEHLVAKGMTLGHEIIYDCEPRTTNVFKQSEAICFEPYVGNFTKIEGQYWFDANLVIRDESGQIILQYKSVWGRDGIGYLPQGILEDAYVIIPGGELELGYYTYTLEIFDKNQFDKVSFEGEFEVTRN